MMKKILSLIFGGLLLVPTAIWIIDPDFGLPVNRIGLAPPRMYTQALLDSQYYKAFDQYYNDSFSLRSPLIFAKRWIDFHVFRMTDDPDVHVGKEGWLYSRRSIENLRKEARDNIAVAERIALNLYTLEKVFEASGRRFFFMVAPSKSTIYPEFVGYAPHCKARHRSLYDLLLEAIGDLPMKNFVRFDLLLSDAKSNYALLYDKTGAYWNELGAMVAAGAIQRQTAEDPEEAMLEYQSFTSVDPDDLNRQIMGFQMPNGDKPVTYFAGTGRPGQPVGIIYGDGYIHKLLPYLQQMFARFDVIIDDRLPSRVHEADLRRYEVIFLEKAESELDSLDVDIGSILSMLGNEVRIHSRHPFDLQAAESVSNISLDRDLTGLEIKSVGDSSVFEIKSLPASDENIFRLLKLSVEAPHADTMTIRHLTAHPYNTSKFLKKGITEIYLPLPLQKLKSIQIQPGRQHGVFYLRSAEIFEFSNHPVYEKQHSHLLIFTETDLEDKFTPVISMKEQDYVSADLQGGSMTDHSLPEITTVSALIEPDKKSKASNTEQISSGDNETSITRTISIKVTDVERGRIFQRNGRHADIVVSGNYTGEPGAIEARVVRDRTHDEIVTWTVIDAAPRNGIYVGVIPNVPQGGWYNIQVRSAKQRDVLTGGTHRWGVGILVACLGQSNMKEWFYTGTDLRSHSLLREFDGHNWSTPGRQGNAAIAFGNRIIERLGIPVGLLDFSVNGSGLRKEADWGTGYWKDTAQDSIYNHFVTGVTNVGGAVEFVVWIHGEADAARGTVTEEEYLRSLESFILQQVRVDIDNGSGQAHLPFLVVAMVKRPGGKDDPHQAIRNAQYRVIEKVPECYLAATTLDLENQGRQHLSAGAYLKMGDRVAQTVLYVLGEEAYHRGPSIAQAKLIDDHTVDVKITHRGGTDFSPNSRITGWEVVVKDTPLSVADVYRQNSQTIRIILERPIAVGAKLRYLYGAMPDATRPVLDNSAMSLPLEEGQTEIKLEK